MGFDPVKDALRKAATRQKILETGFRVFAERTIDDVNLTEIAEAAGVGMATVYRNFNTKQALVLEIGTWMWKQYVEQFVSTNDSNGLTGAEEYERCLDSFINLYRNHRDLLRFNQFFKIYVQRESIPEEQMRPYSDVTARLAGLFHNIYQKAQADGTLRSDVTENEMFSNTIHLMMAAVTHCAVGLIDDSSVDTESELFFLKKLLYQAYLPVGGH